MPKKRNVKKIAKQLATAPMGRLAGESLIAHRAFLIWAMQTKEHRQLSTVGRAVKRSQPTLRDMSVRWLWDQRTVAPGSASLAQAVYRRLYFEKYGMSEIMMVQKNISAPITAFGSAPRSIIDGVEKTLRKTPGDTSAFTQEVKRKHLVLLDAAIGYIAQGIKSGDLRRSLRDLPVLIQLRNELNADTGTGSSKGATAIVDSVRIADAKLNGGDLVEAMYEDSIEIVAILEALRCKGQSGLHGTLSEGVPSEQ